MTMGVDATEPSTGVKGGADMALDLLPKKGRGPPVNERGGLSDHGGRRNRVCQQILGRVEA